MAEDWSLLANLGRPAQPEDWSLLNQFPGHYPDAGGIPYPSGPAGRPDFSTAPQSSNVDQRPRPFEQKVYDILDLFSLYKLPLDWHRAFTTPLGGSYFEKRPGWVAPGNAHPAVRNPTSVRYTSKELQEALRDFYETGRELGGGALSREAGWADISVPSRTVRGPR